MSPSACITMSGLGREFAAEELLSEEPLADNGQKQGEHWRVVRARNKWQPAEDCARHPVPGTYPVVITGEAEWGGWRVPGAEYDLDPAKVEEQARLIASAPQLAAFANGLVDWARKSGEDMPNALVELAHRRPGHPGARQRARAEAGHARADCSAADEAGYQAASFPAREAPCVPKNRAPFILPIIARRISASKPCIWISRSIPQATRVTAAA